MADEEQSWTDQAANWASETYDQAATAASETYDQAATAASETFDQAATWTNETVDAAVTWTEQTYHETENWVADNADAATNSYGATGVAIAEKGVADAAEDVAGNVEFLRVTWAHTKYDLVLTKHQLLQSLASAYSDAAELQAQGEEADPNSGQALGHILDSHAATATNAVNIASAAGDFFADDADRFHQARLHLFEAAGAARWGALVDAIDRQSHLDAIPAEITNAMSILESISEAGTNPDDYIPHDDLYSGQ